MNPKLKRIMGITTLVPYLLEYTQPPSTTIDQHMEDFSISQSWIQHEVLSYNYIVNHGNKSKTTNSQSQLNKKRSICKNLIQVNTRVHLACQRSTNIAPRSLYAWLPLFLSNLQQLGLFLEQYLFLLGSLQKIP